MGVEPDKVVFVVCLMVAAFIAGMDIGSADAKQLTPEQKHELRAKRHAAEVKYESCMRSCYTRCRS